MASTEPMPFEEILARLQTTVEKLESGSLSLEEALRQFEEGVRLAREGSAQLDLAERKVETLLKDAEGNDRVEPFPEPESGEVPS
jgi:exodeoxyribonuclease VII small subunit